MTMGDVNALMRGAHDGSKKTVSVTKDGFLKVSAVNQAGDVDVTNRDILDRLAEVEILLAILIEHAQIVTGEEFTREDFTIERG